MHDFRQTSFDLEIQRKLARGSARQALARSVFYLKVLQKEPSLLRYTSAVIGEPLETFSYQRLTSASSVSFRYLPLAGGDMDEDLMEEPYKGCLDLTPNRSGPGEI